MSWPPTIRELWQRIDRILETLKELEYPEPFDKQGTVYSRIYMTATGRRMSITITDYDEYLANIPDDNGGFTRG